MSMTSTTAFSEWHPGRSRANWEALEQLAASDLAAVPPRSLTIPRAAAHLGLSIQAVNQLIAEGTITELPEHLTPGRRKIHASEIFRYDAICKAWPLEAQAS